MSDIEDPSKTDDNDFYGVDKELTEMPKPTPSAGKIKMPAALKAIVDNFSPFQRKYLELRARGMTQADAAKKAGSTAKGKEAMSRVGYSIEQMDGAKDYMYWLNEQRMKVALVDDIEIVQMLRNVYNEALLLGKLGDANKSAELLGNYIGMFVKDTQKTGIGKLAKEGKEATQNTKTTAFKDDDEYEGTLSDKSREKYQHLQKLLKDLNKTRI